MQDLFVKDEGISKLACWLPFAQAVQEESMSSLECSQITGERDPQAAGLKIQIPPGMSLKDKPHTHTQENCNSKNSTNTSS